MIQRQKINENIKFNFRFYILANIQDAGKYMVRAVNAGGEAQSIADFAVMEPTPERMVEVVKTVVFDNTNDKKVNYYSLLTKKIFFFHQRH